jgi:hypothetical protein
MLLSDHIDGHADGPGGQALVLVAGLIVELGLDEMIARRSGDAGLNDEFAGVDAELCAGIGGQRDDGTDGITGGDEFDACVVGNGEVGGDEVVVAGRVGVDVKPLRHAEVQRDLVRLAGGNRDLLGEEIGDGAGPGDAGAVLRPVRNDLGDDLDAQSKDAQSSEEYESKWGKLQHDSLS